MIKTILKCSNNFKYLTSVYIKLHDDKNKLDYYPRKYFFMIDKLVYVIDLKNTNIGKTNLKDLADIEKLKDYDNKNYGGFF